jgi:hypothetical protein
MIVIVGCESPRAFIQKVLDLLEKCDPSQTSKAQSKQPDQHEQRQ